MNENSDEINNPHDVFVRRILSRKSEAVSLIENYLPPEIVEKIELESLKLTQESFIDENLRSHHTDLLFRASLKNGEISFIYLLLEHKSSPDKTIAFQLLRYMMQIWEKSLKTASFPLIIPLVLYHGKARWRVNRNFANLIKEKDSIFEKFVPHFEYYLLDLSAFPDAELKGSIALQVFFTALKHVFDKDLGANKLLEILLLLKKMQEQTVLEFIETLLRYFVAANDNISKENIQIALSSAFSGKDEKFMSPAARSWIEEGFQKGISQGEERGILKGILQGEQQQALATALRLWRKRFGDINPKNETILKKLPKAKLEQLSEDLLDFEKASDLIAWLKKNAE